MKQYLDIVRETLTKGKRQKNRTGIDTFAVPNQHFSHDMREGFPLLTTKKMAFKAVRVELEGFIKGITDKSWYQERGCTIWDEWANPLVVADHMSNPMNSWDENLPIGEEACRKYYQKEVEDLGPIYGYQWRRFGVPYPSKYTLKNQTNIYDAIKEPLESHDFDYDQLASIVNKLKNNPNDRRMVCSAWNPNQLSLQALPPCHLMFVLTHIDGELSLHWTQRSCDLMLGVPFNIASYALLLELLAKEAGMTAANLSGMLCNCHIYENQLEGAKEQLSRTPQELPQLEITNFKSIWDWTYADVKLHNYNPLDKIDFGEVAI